MFKEFNEYETECLINVKHVRMCFTEGRTCVMTEGIFYMIPLIAGFLISITSLNPMMTELWV